MLHRAESIANYFLEKARSKGEQLDQLKLQKLVYFAHGWCLALYGRPLINEHVEAWDYGPVVRSLYDEFKSAGADFIDTVAFDVAMVDQRPTLVPVPLPGDDETIRLLDRIWEVYGKHSGVQLSNSTHEPGSPWRVTRDENPGIRNAQIPDERIREWFSAQRAAGARAQR